MRRPGAEFYIGDDLQRDRTAADGRHGHILDRRYVAAAVLRHRDPDGNLPVGKREFGGILVNVADRGHADSLAERGGRDPQARGQVKTWFDDDLGPIHVALDAGRPDFLHADHFGNQLVSGLIQQCGIVAAEHDRNVTAHAPARLRLEVYTGIRDLLESGRHAAFPFDRGSGPVFLQGEIDVGAGRLDVGKGCIDEFRVSRQHVRHAPCDCGGLLERAAGHGFDLHLAVIGVHRWLERHWQRPEGEQRSDEGQPPDADGPDAVVA